MWTVMIWKGNIKEQLIGSKRSKPWMPEILEGRVPGMGLWRGKIRREQGIITLMPALWFIFKVIDLHSLVALVKFIEWRIDKSSYVDI